MFLAESSIQLVPDGTLLLHFLFILVMVAVLSRTLLRPINQILIERENRIAGRLSQAKALALAREEKLRRYQSELRSARADGYHLLEQERARALKEREERVQELKQELGTTVSAQIDLAHLQENQIRSELETQAVSIGAQIASKVLGRPTN